MDIITKHTGKECKEKSNKFKHQRLRLSESGDKVGFNEEMENEALTEFVLRG